MSRQDNIFDADLSKLAGEIRVKPSGKTWEGIANKLPGHYSVKHPAYVWAIRMAGVILVLWSTQFPGGFNRDVLLQDDDVKWVDNFLSVNNLMESYQREKINYAEVPETSFDYEESGLIAAQAQESMPVSALATNTSKQVITGGAKPRPEAVMSLPVHSAILAYYHEAELVYDYQRALQLRYALNSGDFDENRKAAVYSSDGKWIAGANAGLQASNAQFGEPLNTYTTQGVHANSSQLLESNVSNAFGVNVQVGIGLKKGFELLAGLNYQNYSGTQLALYDAEAEQTQSVIHYYPQPSPDGNGVEMVAQVEEETYTLYVQDSVKSNYTSQSFEIPLMLRYNFGKSRLIYFLSSGVSATMGANYSSNYSSGNFDKGNYSASNFGPSAVNLLLGVGVKYRAVEGLYISLAPGYRYGIPVGSKSGLGSPASSFGLFTGLSYYFK